MAASQCHFTRVPSAGDRWKEVNTVSTGPALPLPSQPGAGELETQCGGRFTYLPSTPEHPAPAAPVGTAATWAALSPLPP